MYQFDLTKNINTIWHLLLQKGPLKIKEIIEMTSLQESLINFSLGWLFKENKIDFLEQNGVVIVDLKQNSAFELHY